MSSQNFNKHAGKCFTQSLNVINVTCTLGETFVRGIASFLSPEDRSTGVLGRCGLTCISPELLLELLRALIVGIQ